ncbi:hypothetical protein [Salinicola endophyticus]|uniref:Uncharacterized protein n=1 Tax=Salinicola endophyticus TaxID=1949083 RepID=A0AB74UDY8_9GAMM
MNRTNWEHAGIAAGLMLAVFLPLALLAVPGASIAKRCGPRLQIER